jgi:CheY-like chemotaxis protein
MINEIELELRDALAHLYDPGYQPSVRLCSLLACGEQDQAMAVQSMIIRGIEDLKPAPDTPSNARTVRYYEILHNRFVLRLTLEETALRMHMSLSSTWREQRSAIHTLATELWRQNQDQHKVVEAKPGDEKTEVPAEPASWGQSTDRAAQTRAELASLQSLDPDAVSDVRELIAGVIDLQTPLAARRGMKLVVNPLKPNLLAAVHPSVLRQILIVAIGHFIRHLNGEVIALFARLEDGSVKITITGSIDPAADSFEENILGDIPLPDDSTVEFHQEGKQVFLWIKLPHVDRINVLVVDDNADIVRYYQRATEGSSYRIIHYEGGRAIFEAIQKARPDIIVLDVMLPEVDGWELLMQIRANPVTRVIPVLVCSVVREEELAISLGAIRSISKPVRSEDFVRALDQILAQTP